MFFSLDLDKVQSMGTPFTQFTSAFPRPDIPYKPSNLDLWATLTVRRLSDTGRILFRTHFYLNRL